MKKVILIPDLHGRLFWLKAVAEASADTRIIFLGDYTDPYGFEEITPLEAYQIFIEVIDFARHHPNVELLLGNHDCGYLFGKEVCNCRTDKERYPQIRQLFLDNLDLFKFCTEVCIGNRRYLVSHAGINRLWLEAHAGDLYPHRRMSVNTLWKKINECLLLPSHLTDTAKVAMLSEVSGHRGGLDPYSSIVWADIDEFEDSGAHIAVDQIVGHTLQAFEDFGKEEYCIYYGGACVKKGPGSTVYCIDTAEAYYLDSEGVLHYMRNDKAVEENIRQSCSSPANT